MQGEKGEEHPRRKETMKKKHRDKMLKDRNKDKRLIKATRNRLKQEMQTGTDFQSNQRYLKELEQWGKH